MHSPIYLQNCLSAELLGMLEQEERDQINEEMNQAFAIKQRQSINE